MCVLRNDYNFSNKTIIFLFIEHGFEHTTNGEKCITKVIIDQYCCNNIILLVGRI